MSRRNFTVHVEIDYLEDPEGDKEREKAIRTGSLPVPVGTHWRYSVSFIKDSEGRELATQSVLQIERDSLRETLKDMFNRLPRYIDEQGLPNK